ncbi:hypothetical protein B5S29_g5906 [[Candida] boidinii]|nr:hypothetical protein B5S29_g5906 [[Candida] boidinii]
MKVADLKLVLLGESAVGKSSLVQRFQSNTFDNNKESTIGAAFITKKLYLKDSKNENIEKLINLQIWDTAGQERYKSLTPMYYRNSNVAIVVFDMNELSSFKRAKNWILELKNYIEDTYSNSDTELNSSNNININTSSSSPSSSSPSNSKLMILLIGNKCDLLNDQENYISPFEIEINDFLNLNKNYHFIKTSAKTKMGVDSIFDYIIKNINENIFTDLNNNNNDNNGLLSNNNKSLKKSKKSLIDLRFGNSNINDNNYSSCQC